MGSWRWRTALWQNSIQTLARAPVHPPRLLSIHTMFSKLIAPLTLAAFAASARASRTLLAEVRHVLQSLRAVRLFIVRGA
jgi:hypothetical protein